MIWKLINFFNDLFIINLCYFFSMGVIVLFFNELEELKVWDIVYIFLFFLVKFDKIEILNMELNWNKILVNNVI